MNEVNRQKRWQALVVVLLLLSLAAILTLAVFDPARWAGSHSRVFPWQRPSPGGWSMFEQPPRWLSMGGVLLATGLSGILLLYFFPAQVGRMAQAFTRSPGQLARLALVGLAGSGLVIAASLSATVAMGTFPLAVFLSSLLFGVCFHGIIGLAYALGKALLLRAAWDRLSPVLILLYGMLLLFTLNELPILGVLFRVLFLILGSGVAITTRFGTGRSWNLDPLIEG
jgi:hypothetical protein